MSTKIRIGHASISEKSSVTGDPGDQTKKEVCVVDSFDITSLAPHFVLRPKTSELAEKSALACEAGCRNDCIGYSQSGAYNRDSLYSQAKALKFDLAKITAKCNADCSSFMTVCAIAGGADIKYGSSAPATDSMRTRFKTSYDVYEGSIYTAKTDNLRRGDILVREKTASRGGHTVMVLANGDNYAYDTYTDTGAPEVAGSYTDSTIKLIKTSIKSIDTTKVTTVCKVISKTGTKEKPLADANFLGSYVWQYQLVSLTKNTEILKKIFNMSNASTTFVIDGLSQGHSYLLRVTATKKTGSTSFSSQDIIFTTDLRSTDESTNSVFCSKELLYKTYVDKIYIKIGNDFKRAIIQNNPYI